MGPGRRIKAVVVAKGTVFARIRDEQPDAGSAAGGGTFWRKIVAAHESHEASLAHTVGVIDSLGWGVDVMARDEFERADGYDLVITVGGDGTVLSASHKTIGVPLVGVNSDPARSVGYFCATDFAGVEGVLKAFEQDALTSYTMHRMRIQVDGCEAGPPVLNDVLLSNANPGATSRYALYAGNRVEHHRSSGIWVSTAAGSTAGIRSAGGAVLPLEMPLLQYLVREPVISPLVHYELLRGVREMGEGIKVVSEMEHGYAYMDGPFESIPLGVGACMEVSAHEPLTIMGLEPSRRER